jgi:CBS domain-containing protein
MIRARRAFLTPWQEPTHEESMRATDVMTKDVATVTPDTLIVHLCDLFRERRITGAPVVDQGGRLVGIVSKDDVLFRGRGIASEPRQSPDIRSLFTSGFVGFDQGGNGAARVGEIMTRDVLSAPEESTVDDLCRLMWEHRIHRVPIVRGALLVGIVSALDVCRAVMSGTIGAR